MPIEVLLLQGARSQYAGALAVTLIVATIIAAILAFLLWYYWRKRSGK